MCIQRSTKNSRTVFTNCSTTESIFIELRLESIEAKNRPTLTKIVKDGRQCTNKMGKDCENIH